MHNLNFKTGGRNVSPQPASSYSSPLERFLKRCPTLPLLGATLRLLPLGYQWLTRDFQVDTA